MLGNLQYPHMLKEGILSVRAWASGNYLRESMVSVLGTNQLLGYLHWLEIKAKEELKGYEGFRYQAGQDICMSLQGMMSDVCLPKGAKRFSCSSLAMGFLKSCCV